MREKQRGRALGWVALGTLVIAGLVSVLWLELLARRPDRSSPAALPDAEAAPLSTAPSPRAVRLLDPAVDNEEGEPSGLEPVAREIPRRSLALPSLVSAEAELGSPWDEHWASVRPRLSSSLPGVDLEITGPPDHYFIAFVGPGDSEVLLPVAAGRLDASGVATLPAIFPSGAALRVPDLSPDRYYVVQEGDAPDEIARRFYGNGALWQQILRHNRFEWTELKPGEVLVLPHPSPEDLPPGAEVDVNRRTVFVRLAIVPADMLR